MDLLACQFFRVGWRESSNCRAFSRFPSFHDAHRLGNVYDFHFPVVDVITGLVEEAAI